MAGIYIHIPFCKQACHYCDFHFSTSLANKGAFLDALKKEMRLQKDYLANQVVSTVYFGGGTPSLLSKDELLDIFRELLKNFKVTADAEVTLECNPDDLTKEKLTELRQTPVNRLSIGIQSFFDEDLRFMNRAHNASEAMQCVQLAQKAGFSNITIDLIYGTPTLSNENWKKNLSRAFELGVQHISAYSLTVEPRTALADMVAKKKAPAVDDEKSLEQFVILMQEMKANGFIQYEISNFGRPGFFSRHNSNYWKGEYYLGLGPSAHSYNGISRQWNVRNNNNYIASLNKEEIDLELEMLDPAQKYNEYVLTTLRTMWGTDLDHITERMGIGYRDYFLKEARPYFESQHLVEGTGDAKNKVFLSDKGKLIADRIASDLFKT